MDRSECIAGVRDVAPAVPPVVPVGMLFGATAVGTGFTAASATALSLFAFAGTAQLAAVELLREGATLRVVLATIVLINLRYVVFSASLAPKVRHLSRPWRALVAYPLFDLNYALAEARFADVDVEEGHRGWYMLGVSLPLVAALVAGTLAGALLGEAVGAGVPLDFAITLVFVALLAPQIAGRASALAAVGAAVVAVAAAGLPVNLGLLVAVLCGTVVGVSAETRQSGETR
jgi:4-azaleucine resistance transporter AzlC